MLITATSLLGTTPSNSMMSRHCLFNLIECWGPTRSLRRVLTRETRVFRGRFGQLPASGRLGKFALAPTVTKLVLAHDWPGSNEPDGLARVTLKAASKRVPPPS